MSIEPDFYIVGNVQVKIPYTFQQALQQVPFKPNKILKELGYEPITHKLKLASNITKFCHKQFSISEVEQLLDTGTKLEISVNNVLLKVNTKSLRYQLFRLNKQCVKCGLVGEYYKLESHINDLLKNNSRSAHFNLYGVRNDEEILMTKDHILPKCRGGQDQMDNLQTMCVYCNREKGSRIEN